LYRCLFLGADPLGLARPRGHRLFLVDKINQSSAVDGRTLGTIDYQHFDWINWSSFFKQHPDPPNVLAIRVPQDPDLQLVWESQFLDRSAGKRPKYLVVLEQAGDVLQNHSGIYRAPVKQFQRAGYKGVLKHVDFSSCGSPTWGSYFATIYYQQLLGIDDDQAFRSFQNCLKPVGVPQKLWDPKAWVCQEAKVPPKPNHLGHVWQQPVVDPGGPVLLDPKVRVLLPAGLRQLDPEEWVKIKGLPGTWRHLGTKPSEELLRAPMPMNGVPWETS
jgi:hypothetical protein